MGDGGNEQRKNYNTVSLVKLLEGDSAIDEIEATAAITNNGLREDHPVSSLGSQSNRSDGLGLDSRKIQRIGENSKASHKDGSESSMDEETQFRSFLYQQIVIHKAKHNKDFDKMRDDLFKKL